MTIEAAKWYASRAPKHASDETTEGAYRDMGNLQPVSETFASGCQSAGVCYNTSKKGANVMAWHTIQATDDLRIELCPAGVADNQQGCTRL
jgi:hypothetical protein